MSRPTTCCKDRVLRIGFGIGLGLGVGSFSSRRAICGEMKSLAGRIIRCIQFL